MSAVIVCCPHCGKELKVRNPALLGKKGKCPKCAKPFVLREVQEEEVELQLAEDELPVGTSARWVPDEPARAPAAVSVEAPVITTSPAVGGIVDVAAEDDGLARLREIKRRSARNRNIGIAVGAVLAVGVFAAVCGTDPAEPLAQTPPAAESAAGPAEAPAVAAVGASQMPTASGGGARIPSVSVVPGSDSVILPHQNLVPSQLKSNKQVAETLVPKQGEPIRLYMVPSGVNVVIHLRPALLWSEEPVWQELRYSLTEDVTNWIAAKLREHCRREPQQIEECLICLRLGARGTEPLVSSVVRLVEEEKLSDLIEEFRGQPINPQGVPRINISEPHSYLIHDTKTVAIAAAADAHMLQEFIQTPNFDASEGVYSLLEYTDSSRVFTVLFEMDDVKRHDAWLFSESALPVFRKVLDWFGDDVQAVAWSVNVGDEVMTSDLLLRTRSVATPAGLARDMLLRMEELPRDLMAACRKMQPQSKGFREIIGRFPAMMEVVREATVPSTESRHLRLATALPRKAAPNLALGTLLTWDESLRTDFSSEAPAVMVAEAPQDDLPATVEGRLDLVVSGDVAMPFEGVIEYIAGETKLKFDIDGNALKDAGFTKNMPQKLELGNVSVRELLKHLAVSNRPPSPDKRICIVVDEANKSVLVTTEFFATNQGQTIYPLVTE